jgi:hypothetical protein
MNCSFPYQGRIFTCFQRVQNSLISTHPPTQWLRGALCPELMCLRRKVGHSLPRSVEVQKGVVPPLPHLPLCGVLNLSYDSFILYVYWLLVIILFCGAQNISLNVSVVVHFDHLRFQDTERRCSLKRGGTTSHYSVTFTVMVMRTSNVKLVILTGTIMSCNIVEYIMYRAHIHSRCSRVIGEKAWQARRLLW